MPGMPQGQAPALLALPALVLQAKKCQQ